MKYLSQDRLPHALLLHGNSGLGIDIFSKKFAHVILCDSSLEQKPCMQCHSCRLFETSNHPDFQLIEPNKNGSSIQVDDIREVGNFLHTTDHYGHGKVTVVISADAMTRSAANSLLKTLEEPPAECKILLVSSQPSRLLSTVISRCQKIYFPDVDKDEAIRWLKEQIDYSTEDLVLMLGDISSLQPLDAYDMLCAGEERQSLVEFNADCQALLDDSIKLNDVVNKWSKCPSHQIYRWLLNMTHKSILTHCLGKNSAIDIARLYKLYDRQVAHYRSLDVRLNPQLMLESALLEFRSIYTK